MSDPHQLESCCKERTELIGKEDSAAFTVEYFLQNFTREATNPINLQLRNLWQEFLMHNNF